MPIRPSERARYPKDWKAISARIRERSGGQCECLGECGVRHRYQGAERCPEFNGLPAAEFKGKVVFTTAHLNHTPEDNRPENLKAMCQRCHLLYDLPHHQKNARVTREAKKGPALPGMEITA